MDLCFEVDTNEDDETDPDWISSTEKCVDNASPATSLDFRENIGGVMVSILASSAVDFGFELQLGQTTDYIKLVFVASLPTMQH
jgi:hypothetical protein